MPPDDPIIIGGGVAGLTAALHLAERGLKPLVLEADPQFIGGRLAGKDDIEVNGWRFPLEHGVHGIWSPYRNLQAMLARHNLRPVFVPAQEELWIYRELGVVRSAPVGSAIRHSWFPAPLHYLQLFLNPRFLLTIDIRDWLRLLHVWSVLIMAVGIDPFGENQPMEGMMLSETIRKWSPALRGFFTGLARNGLSTHADEIPLAGFLAFLRFYTILRRDAWVFSYLPNGGGTDMCQPLSARIKALGGEIRLGVKAIRLEKEDDGWTVQAEQDGQCVRFISDHVILAVDSPSAATLIQNSFPAEAQSLTFPRGMANAVIRLWFDRPPKPGPEAGIFTGDFILHNFFWLERIYAPYRAWSKATGGTAIEVHVYGPPEVLEQPDALLLTHAIMDFYQAYPELRGHLIVQNLQRNPATHTLPCLGARGTHLGIETPWEGLFCAGDWVRDPLPAFFLERACATGIKAANAVLKSHGHEPWPLVEYLPPEPFVGWIESQMVKGRRRIRERKNKESVTR
jgi:isorenieratene synthase